MQQNQQVSEEGGLESTEIRVERKGKGCGLSRSKEMNQRVFDTHGALEAVSTMKEF